MIVVATSVWIPYLDGHQTPEVARLLSIERLRDIIVGDLVLVEILRGARSDAAATLIEREMRKFELRSISSPALASRAAANYRDLRGLGITIRSTIDVLIATFCIEYDHVLLHKDRDFAHFERLLGLRAFSP